MPVKSFFLSALAMMTFFSAIPWGFAQDASGFSLSEDDEDPKRPTVTDKEEAARQGVVVDPTDKTPLDFVSRSKQKVEGEWVMAPIPSYNPSQGWGLALMVQKIFAHNPDSKPSMLGGAVFGTEKKSYGGMLGYIGRLNDDHLRLNVFGGAGRINSDFYGVGKNQGSYNYSVLLEQDFAFAAIQLLPKWGDLYIGPTLSFTDMKNKFDVQGLPPTINVSDKLDNQTWVPGLKLQLDERDNSFYPTHGYLASLTTQFYDANLGGNYTFQKYHGIFDEYLHLWDENVLAMRAAMQANVGDVPFYDMAVFGQGPDLRGYKAGKYRDKILWATQAEYRQRFTDHWGGVVFAGMGDVAHSMSDLKLTDLLWSGGVGARYRIAVRNPVDFRIDVAYGDEWAWYFSANQAF